MQGAAALSLLVSLFFCYLLVVGPLIRWGREGGHRRMASRVVDSIDRVRLSTARVGASRKQIKPQERPIEKRTSPMVMKISAAVVIGMFIYMPSYIAASNGMYLDFSYRFLWDMGKDGYYIHMPHVPLLLTQLAFVVVIAGLLSLSKRS